jgi:hypothetical protein
MHFVCSAASAFVRKANSVQFWPFANWIKSTRLEEWMFS